ncbi:MAG TPA: hypothetical protein VGR66_01315 [Candidatus Eisenbacteria bacterium]|nr:hypothetical protein [Candidatus Eisenbacteria bacterium]
MTDSSPPETRQPEPPTKRGGFRLRLFLLIVTPVALLGAGGAYLLFSLAPRDSSLSDFLPAYLTAAALAVTLAAVLAWAADLALRNRLAAVERTLAQGSRGTESLAAVERQWAGLRRVARAAHETVSRVDDRSQDAEELKALQAAADDLLEKIRVWSETEIAPSFEAGGPLSELAQALGTLARHLDEKNAEAREVAELARQSVGEAYEGIERANRESSRSAREIAALLTASAEVKRLAGDLTARFREPVRVAPSEVPAPVAKEPEVGPELELWRERVASLTSRLESLERLALRGALELAAEGIAERREAGPWLDRVETLRHVALGARALREESKAIATETAAVLLSSLQTTTEPAPTPAATASLPVELVAMVERVEQWGSDAHSRGERLSALSQRLASEFAAATGLARAGADELAGLAARFTARSAVAETEEAETASESWPAGARPLRLLTREDVVPDDDDAPGAAEGTPRDG